MPHAPTSRRFSTRAVAAGTLLMMLGGVGAVAVAYGGGYAAAAVAFVGLRGGHRGRAVAFAAFAVLHGLAWQAWVAWGNAVALRTWEHAAFLQGGAALLFPPALAGAALLVAVARGADLAPGPLADGTR